VRWVVSLIFIVVLANAQEVSPKFGVSFSPIGFSLGLELLSQETSFSNTATVIYDSTLDSHLGVQLMLRHDHQMASGSWGVQLGSWEHDPHLLDNTETALGILADGLFSIQDLRLEGRLGVLHLQSYQAFQIDARASAGFYKESFDSFGYRKQGYAFRVTGLHGATPRGGVWAAWADAWYTYPLKLLSDHDVAEIALRVGYKPEEVVPPLRMSSWGAVLSAGYRTGIPIDWNTGLFSLERITLEPKVRIYGDKALHLATDISVGLDLQRDKPSTIVLNVGYSQGLWFKVGFLSPF
jgi:hypothetical protein